MWKFQYLIPYHINALSHAGQIPGTEQAILSIFTQDKLTTAFAIQIKLIHACNCEDGRRLLEVLILHIVIYK